MSEVEVSINGRSYRVVGEEGEEERIRSLGETVDERARQLVSAIGQVGQQQLLLMVSLTLADELSETAREVDAAAERVRTLVSQLEQGYVPVSPDPPE